MDTIFKELLEKGWKLIGINPVSKLFARKDCMFFLHPINGILIDKENNKHSIAITKDTPQLLEDIIGLEETLEK
jgi:hypothetical protein